MIDTQAIAQRIRDGRRHRRRVTQEAFALELGINQSAVSDLENGKKGSGIYDLNRLKLLAQGLNMDLRYLVFGMGDDGLTRFTALDRFEAISTRRITKAHREHLERLSGEIDWKKRLISAMEFSTYRMYVLENESETSFQERLCVVIFDDRIVATAKAKAFRVEALNEVRRLFKDESVYELIERRMNPFESLLTTADVETIERYTLEAEERHEALSVVDDEEVVVIEALFVEAKLREHGLSRLMINGLADSEMTSVWLSLKPVTELIETIEGVPRHSPANLGQMTLNASIAERLGLTIESMREPVEINAKEETAVLPCHAWAYRLSPALAAISDDDELVQEFALTQARLAHCTAKLLAKQTKEKKQ